MINIEVRGIPCTMDEEPLSNIDILEAVSDIESGDITKMPKFFKAAFGDEQYQNIKDSLRGEDGICRVNTLMDFYREAMQAAADAKKADSKN